MLPLIRKWVVVNNSGQLLTWTAGGRINVKETAWFITPATGKIDYTTLTDDDLGFVSGQSVADGSEVVGDNEVSNASDLYLGSLVQLEITHDEGLAADGTFDLYLAEGDLTGELQTDASGYANAEGNLLFRVGSLTWESNGLDDEIMRSEVFNIGG